MKANYVKESKIKQYNRELYEIVDGYIRFNDALNIIAMSEALGFGKKTHP